MTKSGSVRGERLLLSGKGSVSGMTTGLFSFVRQRHSPDELNLIEPRTAKQVPCAIIFPSVRRNRESSERDQLKIIVLSRGRCGIACFCVNPIGVEQQPCRSLVAQILNNPVQDIEAPRRIGDEEGFRLRLAIASYLRAAWR